MSTPRGRILAGIFVTAVALRLASAASGASPEAGDPTYRGLRYNDDFSYLADPSKAIDAWDKIKYIPIADGRFGPSTLSFGGELRERIESYLNPNFALRAPPSNVYLLHRLQLHADLHVTDHWA